MIISSNIYLNCKKNNFFKGLREGRAKKTGILFRIEKLNKKGKNIFGYSHEIEP